MNKIVENLRKCGKNPKKTDPRDSDQKSPQKGRKTKQNLGVWVYKMGNGLSLNALFHRQNSANCSRLWPFLMAIRCFHKSNSQLQNSGGERERERSP